MGLLQIRCLKGRLMFEVCQSCSFCCLKASLELDSIYFFLESMKEQHKNKNVVELRSGSFKLRE